MYRQGVMAATGDYYRGDGLFSFIGKGLKAVSGFLPGPLGGIAKVAGGLLSPAQKAVATRPQVYQSQIGGALPPPPTFSGFQMGGSVAIGSSAAAGAGSRPTAVTHVTGDRKRRRMNVTNVKALRRAGRRVKGFEKLARRFIGFSAPRKPRGRMYFRTAKKRS